jgi:hypothetical protein
MVPLVCMCQTVVFDYATAAAGHPQTVLVLSTGQPVRMVRSLLKEGDE